MDSCTKFAPEPRSEPIDNRSLCKALDLRAQLRDARDVRFGKGLFLLRISRLDRRDRLLLLNAFAVHLLTMLGTAAEELGRRSESARPKQVDTVKSNEPSVSAIRSLHDLTPIAPDVFGKIIVSSNKPWHVPPGLLVPEITLARYRSSM